MIHKTSRDLSNSQESLLDECHDDSTAKLATTAHTVMPAHQASSNKASTVNANHAVAKDINRGTEDNEGIHGANRTVATTPTSATETLVLSNGVRIPRLGLGVWLVEDDEVTEVVRTGIDLGYRHIDTAQAYYNEEGVGKAIRTCKVPRNELFVTSKIAAEHKNYESAAASIDESLKTMGLDYLDLMLIHSPQPWTAVNQSNNRFFAENLEVWGALEDAYDAGKLRAIGVSNFTEADIDNLLDAPRVRPMVNQVLAHITNTPFEVLDYCRNKGIVTEAYSPIAHGLALRNAKIEAMARSYGVSVAQLCIRYAWQLGMVVLPKSTKPDHMASNLAIDFSITDADMNILKAMDHISSYEEFSDFVIYGGKLDVKYDEAGSIDDCSCDT